MPDRIKTKIKENELYVVSAIYSESLMAKHQNALEGQVIKVLAVLDPRPMFAEGNTYDSVHAVVCSGKHTGHTYVFSGIALEPSDGENLCTCLAFTHPHETTYPGCRSQLEGPFCGKCGLPCGIVEERTTDPVPYGDRMEDLTTVEEWSDCCTKQLYDDASLTQEFES